LASRYPHQAARFLKSPLSHSLQVHHADLGKGFHSVGRLASRRASAPKIACLFLALLVFSPALVRAQQPGNVSLQADEQLFSVLAAINAAGYDSGLGAEAANSVRVRVRERLAKEDIAVLPELRKFYQEHRIAGNPGADLGQYVSLALLLGPPPGFALTVPQSDLPPDAKKVVGLRPLLEKFYAQGSLEAIWSSAQPASQAEIERYSEPVRRSIELTDAYLRFPSGAYLGRKYTIYLALLASPNQVQARTYGSDYHLVVGPSKELRLAEIRHQYLHFLLDPLAVKYAALIHQKAALQGIARQVPVLGQDFKDDFSLLLTECLIRAVEIRLDKPDPEVVQKRVKELTESGLILTPYFFDKLGEYEKQESSMSVFYQDMVQGIDVDKEQEQLVKVNFAQRPEPPKTTAQPAAQPATTELERWLDEGENDIYEGHYADAKTVFQSVLQKFDPKNERALFGLAVVASNTRKPDTAEEYFRKVLESASDMRLVTWSHIYLGRIQDLKGDRKGALEQYRAASLTAAHYPEAVRAIQNGMALPFGAEK
jgi:tetratricopeptide (TPR) repeat protein